MPPNTPHVAWDPDALRTGAQAIDDMAIHIRILNEIGDLHWHDWNVKTKRPASPFDGSPNRSDYQESVCADAATAYDLMISTLAKALTNLAEQVKYGSTGLNLMADLQEGSEDANIAAAYKTLKAKLPITTKNLE